MGGRGADSLRLWHKRHSGSIFIKEKHTCTVQPQKHYLPLHCLKVTSKIQNNSRRWSHFCHHTLAKLSKFFTLLRSSRYIQAKIHQVVLSTTCSGRVRPPPFCTHDRKGVKRWDLNLFQSGSKVSLSPVFTPSSVNDSYSACVVVYSFPAVKGCPLKVPFVHRLHFVIQITPFFSPFRNGARLTGCPRVWQAGKMVSAYSTLGDNLVCLSLRNKSPPLYLPDMLYFKRKLVWNSSLIFIDKRKNWKDKKLILVLLLLFLPLCLHCLVSS